MLQIAILLGVLNLVLAFVYISCQNAISNKLKFSWIGCALLCSINVVSGLAYAVVVASLILRSLGDYHTDLERTKHEEHDMYFHN